MGNLIGGVNNGTINPILGALANNGGPTFTHALLAGSPAINAGSNAKAIGLTNDQRGAPFLRIDGGTVDIGAYERQSAGTFSLVVDTLVDELDGNFSAGDLSLREAINAANGFAGANTITFAPALNGTIALTLGQLQINDDVTITGPGANLLTIDAQQKSRVFDVTNAVANVTFAGLTISSGKATGFDNGGGIHSLHTGTLTLTDSTVRGNTTTVGIGGGIYADTGAVIVTNSTISGNSTTGNFAPGGGIYTRSGNLTVTNSTVSGNTTTGFASDGGGISAFSGNVMLINSTIVNNSSKGNGGGLDFSAFDGKETLTIANTIIAGNTDTTDGSHPDLFIAATNGGDMIYFSLIGDNKGTTLVEAPVGKPLIVNLIGGATNGVINPMIGPLANNGGPTFTHKLLPGSRAINAGSNFFAMGLTTDQRGVGFPRIDGIIVDIGAFEADSTPPAAPVIVSITNDTGTSATDRITNDNTLVFSGTAEAGSTLRITQVGAGEIGTATADAMGNFAFDYTAATLPDGVLTFTAVAQDSSGNTSPVSGAFTVTVDTTSPTVTVEQAVGQADPTTGNSVTFTATFSEVVTGFDQTDVVIGGTAGATTVTVTDTGDGRTFTITVGGFAQAGTVTASVNAGAATDAAGNANLASTSVDNTVTVTMVVIPTGDTTRPTVTVGEAAGQTDPTTGSTVSFIAKFNEVVTGFDRSDVVIGGTAGATTVTIEDLGDGQNFIITVSGFARSGTVTASIIAGAAIDAAGNPNLASTSVDNTVTVIVEDIPPRDTTRPTVTVGEAAGQADPTTGSTVSFIATFSEVVTGFDQSDVVIGGTAGATTVTIEDLGDGQNFIITVSGFARSGTVTASIIAGAAIDAAGNPNLASTSVDNTVTVTLAPPPLPPYIGQNTVAPYAVGAGYGRFIKGCSLQWSGQQHLQH